MDMKKRHRSSWTKVRSEQQKKVNYKNELHKRIEKNDCPKHKARPVEIKFSPNAQYPSERKQNKRKRTDNGINLVDRQNIFYVHGNILQHPETLLNACLVT